MRTMSKSGYRKTAKRGGEIKHNIFKHILSIGYELESSNFAKLSLIQHNTGANPILLNTDTASNDLKMIHEPFDGDPDDDPMLYRKQEPVEFPTYTTFSIDSTNKTKEPNALFQVLNDAADTAFNKRLLNLCKEPIEASVAIEKQERMEQEGDDEELDETELEHSILRDIKNELYRFQPLDGSPFYKINFETWVAPKDCGTFSDIEWLFTYYKPPQSPNVILDTYVNVAKNLIYHLQQLKPIPGNLIAYFSEKDQEIIGSPKTRILYNYPGTNLYYLQTHSTDKQLTYEDLCLTPQMTFSCDIQHLYDIMLEMVRDTTGKFKSNKSVSDAYIEVMERVNKCVDALFKPYREIFDPKSETTKRIRNYVFMILFKLYRYYNTYLPTMKDKNKYFKDSLFLNSRHDNGQLYNQLKTLVRESFGGSSAVNVATIIQDLIIQPPILEKYLANNVKNLRKNVFKQTNVLEKTNSHYGDPAYSLISYFHFLEDPIIVEDNESRVSSAQTIASTTSMGGDSPAASIITVKGTSTKSNDWFVYADIDIFSRRMDIKNHVVLVEMRFFAAIIRSYMSSIADTEMWKEMRQGICNARNPDVNVTSYRGLQHMVRLVESGRSPTKRTRTTKKKTATVAISSKSS